ncbi:type VI secretion system protein TssA [Frischella perrara]|nr:type VI secretion system protein TssA [Frischella perrara]
MQELQNHPWLNIILEDIPDPTLPVNEHVPLWDYIETNIACMGTISHSSIDMDKLQESILLLLRETKDLRVVAHLLRTLQHAKKPQDILLATYIFSAYILKYWLIVPPQPRLKAKLFKQIILRFSQANKIFESEATNIEKKITFNNLQSIKFFFDENQQHYDDDFIDLLQAYERFANQSSNQNLDNSKVESTYKKEETPKNITESKSEKSSTVPLEQININQDNEAAWKRTLIKVSEILFLKSPHDPISVNLRRYAIFSSLSEPINNNNITDLMAVPADRIREYKANIPSMNIEQWAQIENELTLMPFWLEGHYISASIASQLGFKDVALAILNSVQILLNRLPKLYDLKYNDHSPFISDEMKKWLKPKQKSSENQISKFEEVVFNCYEEMGLPAAIQLLEENSHSIELRNNYYCQKINVQLLKHAGFEMLAKQQASSILAACENITLSEWEPSFIDTLTELTK